MHARLIALACLPMLGLAACTPPGVVANGSRNPTYAIDLAGKAAVCRAPNVDLTQSREPSINMATGGGGWCGIGVTQGGVALTAALLTERPHAGRVHVHTVGDATRVDYIPTGAPRADAFAVKFIPGDQTMRVTVTGAEAGK